MRALSAQDHLAWIERKLEESKMAIRNNGNEIVIRDMPRNKAMEEVRSLFANGRTLYYSDIVKKLGLDLELVVDICNELLKKGEISVDA